MLSEAQLIERKRGIGGSDIAAVLGLSPYATPFDIWQNKLDLAEKPDLSDNEYVHFGNILEDVVADEFSRRTGLKPRRRNQMLAHKEHPFLLANIDREITGKPFGVKCGLECKTADVRAAKPHLWGEGALIEWDGDTPVIVHHDDQVPDWYYLQCAHYMAVTDADLWFLAVLIGGNQFRYYTIKRDLELEQSLIAKASRFWHDHVLAQVPPPPANVVDLETLYSVDNGQAIEATPEILDVWAEIKELQAQQKAIEARMDGQTVGKTKVGGLKNRLRMFIGENAEVLLGSEGKPLATWKASKKRRKVFDQAALERDHPELAKQYTKQVAGSRVLLIK